MAKNPKTKMTVIKDMPVPMQGLSAAEAHGVKGGGASRKLIKCSWCKTSHYSDELCVPKDPNP